MTLDLDKLRSRGTHAGPRKPRSELIATDFDNYLKQHKPKPKPKKPLKQSTGFDAYLKVCKPQQAPTSFEAFLKNTSLGEVPNAATEEQSKQHAAAPEPKAHQVGHSRLDICLYYLKSTST